MTHFSVQTTITDPLQVTSSLYEEIRQTVVLTCHCNQGTKELDQGQHEGDAKITR